MERGSNTSTTSAVAVVPSIASRRVTRVPPELAPTLSVSSFYTCLSCHKHPQPLIRCLNCGLPLYCSFECRKQDLHRHTFTASQRQLKKAVSRIPNSRDGCLEITHANARAFRARRKLRSNASRRRQWYNQNFPNEFLNNFDRVLEGRFSADPFMRSTLAAQSALAVKLAHNQSLVVAVEESLNEMLKLKCFTYLDTAMGDHGDNDDGGGGGELYVGHGLDVLIAGVLLKLYRENDAVGFILYWLDWRSRGPHLEDLRDDLIQSRRLNEWPFPVVENARFCVDMASRFSNFPEQQAGTSVPIEFCLTVLVIHVRWITVYEKRSLAVDLFLNQQRTSSTEIGLDDIQSHILSFLIAGGRERYLSLRKQIDFLMDYIDARDGVLLKSLLVLPSDKNRKRREDCSVDNEREQQQRSPNIFQKFLNDFANGEPVVATIKTVLAERYRVHYQ